MATSSEILDFLFVGEANDNKVEVDPFVFAGFCGNFEVAGFSRCYTGSRGWFFAGSGVGEDSGGNIGHGRIFWTREVVLGSSFLNFEFFLNRANREDLGSFILFVL